MEDGLLGVSGVSVLFAVLKDFNVGVVSVTIQFLLMEELLVLEKWYKKFFVPTFAKVKSCDWRAFRT